MEKTLEHRVCSCSLIIHIILIAFLSARILIPVRDRVKIEAVYIYIHVDVL